VSGFLLKADQEGELLNPNPDKPESKIDGFVKSHKKANFQISNLIISISYELEI